MNCFAYLDIVHNWYFMFQYEVFPRKTGAEYYQRDVELKGEGVAVRRMRKVTILLLTAKSGNGRIGVCLVQESTGMLDIYIC